MIHSYDGCNQYDNGNIFHTAMMTNPIILVECVIGATTTYDLIYFGHDLIMQFNASTIFLILLQSIQHQFSMNKYKNNVNPIIIGEIVFKLNYKCVQSVLKTKKTNCIMFDVETVKRYQTTFKIRSKIGTLADAFHSANSILLTVVTILFILIVIALLIPAIV